MVFGLLGLAYPTVSNFLVEQNSSRVVSSYDAAVEALSDEEAEAMMEAAREYNAELAGLAGVSAEEGGADAGSVSASALAERYESLLNLNGDGVMGYISIPRLDETLPIYHGTEEAVLQVATGHIDTSSLPVGGASTHAAISGHRGLPSAKLFTDLDKMQVGDVFYIRVLKTTLAYEVDQIETVLPTEADSLTVTAGDDYVTLVTCTPYGINSHRLLVRGHAIPYTEDMADDVGAAGNPINIPLPYLLLMIALAALGIFIAAVRVRERRCSQRELAHRGRAVASGGSPAANGHAASGLQDHGGGHRSAHAGYEAREGGASAAPGLIPLPQPPRQDEDDARAWPSPKEETPRGKHFK